MMFEITFYFTDNFGAESATFIGKAMTNGLDGFVGVEFEVADKVESRWFNKNYVKEISSKKVKPTYKYQTKGDDENIK